MSATALIEQYAASSQCDRDALLDYAVAQKNVGLQAFLARTCEPGSAEDVRLAGISTAPVRIAWISNPKRARSTILEVLLGEKRPTVVASAISAEVLPHDTLVEIARTSPHPSVHRAVAKSKSADVKEREAKQRALLLNPNYMLDLSHVRDNGRWEWSNLIDSETEAAIVSTRAHCVPMEAVALFTDETSIDAVIRTQLLDCQKSAWVMCGNARQLATMPATTQQQIDTIIAHLKAERANTSSRPEHWERTNAQTHIDSALQEIELRSINSPAVAGRLRAIAAAKDEATLIAQIDDTVLASGALVAAVENHPCCNENVLSAMVRRSWQYAERLSHRADLSTELAATLIADYRKPFGRFAGRDDAEQLFDVAAATSTLYLFRVEEVTPERLLRQSPDRVEVLLRLFDRDGSLSKHVNAELARLTSQAQLHTFVTLGEGFGGSFSDLVELALAFTD